MYSCYEGGAITDSAPYQLLNNIIFRRKKMTSTLYQLVNHKIIVQEPKNMHLDSVSKEPICPECDQSFISCLCPKPWSSLKTDGFDICWDDERMVAYPSLEVYEELLLWIFRNKEHIICGHCLESVSMEWLMTPEVTEKIVEQFFVIHQGCYTSDNVEMFLLDDTIGSGEYPSTVEN
jgi:hypothetical protein